MKYFTTLAACLAFLSVSCDSSKHEKKNETKEQATAGSPKALHISYNQSDILKDYSSWYQYTAGNIILSSDFIPLAVDSTELSKKEFLTELLTANVYAINIMKYGDRPVYKLFEMDPNLEEIRSTTRQLAGYEYFHQNMEGKLLPTMNFTDLNGTRYNEASLRGKVLVLKLWFIRCTACVKEFPEVNKLVELNQDNKDVVFLSLAMDSADELSAFLKKKELQYAVIPDMTDYMAKKLNVQVYPTHIVVDKTGKIVKVVNSVEELEYFIERSDII